MDFINSFPREIDGEMNDMCLYQYTEGKDKGKYFFCGFEPHADLYIIDTDDFEAAATEYAKRVNEGLAAFQARRKSR